MVRPVRGPARWASGFGGDQHTLSCRTPPGLGSLAHATTLPAGIETVAAVAKSLQLPLLSLEQPQWACLLKTSRSNSSRFTVSAESSNSC